MFKPLRIALALLCLLSPLPAQAKPLVADISQYEIAIDSGFTGARLILFGARQMAGDVLVVVRGPAHDYVLRKKDRVAGVWVNRSSMRLEGIPDYYALASTKPPEDILSPEMLRVLGIGMHNLPYLPLQPDDALSPAQRQEFAAAFIDDRQRKRLYAENTLGVTFMGDTLFKTTLPFPDITPRGQYTAETYLIYDGRIVGVQSTPLLVAKRGFDAAIYHLAHEYPASYGILAVLMAIGMGLTASTLFRKL